MNTRILISMALGFMVAGLPAWGAPRKYNRGGGKTLVKGAARPAKKAAPKPLPKFPLNALPGLQQASKQLASDTTPGLKAIPFTMLTYPEQSVIYEYNFMNLNGAGCYLIYAGERMIVTAGRISGNYMVNNMAIHVWNAGDFSYRYSVLVNGCGLGVAPDICVDEPSGQMVIGIEPDRDAENGGYIGYNPESGDFEISKHTGPVINYGAQEGKPFPLSLPTFASMKGFHGLKVPMDDIKALQKVPQLHGLVHHFVSEGEETIRRIDFNTLRMRPAERIPHASEVSLSDIEGLPELPGDEGYATEVKDDGSRGFLLIYPEHCNTVMGAFMEKEDNPELPIMVYDPSSKKLIHHPGEYFMGTGGMGYQPYYRFTERGHIVHNAMHSIRGGGGWVGPMLVDPETGKNSAIVINGKTPEGDCEVAYRIDGDVPGGESLGTSLCVWAPVPGDDTKSYLLLGGENVCAHILIDETTKTGRVIGSWSGTWGRSLWAKNISNPVWLPDKQWLCLPIQENCWAVIEIKDFTQPAEDTYSICTGANGAWVLILKDGRYAGSPGCEKLLYGRMENNIWMPMNILAPWRNRPAEVLEAIGGNPDDVAALRETTKRWLAKQNLNPDSMPPESSALNTPTFTIGLPTPMCDTPELTLNLELSARPGRAAAGVEVRVNGALVPQEWSNSLVLPAGRKIPLDIKLPLNYGQNNMSITGVDTLGNRSDSVNVRFVRPGNANSRLFVVTLGVSDYDDDSLDLQFAAKDARDMAAAFSEHGSGEVKVLTLTDKEVANRGVLDKVKEFLAESTIDDRVVLYLAGHGMLDDKLEYHYAPAAFDAEKVAATGISMDALVACMQDVPARERLLLLDTCHSGQLGEAGEEKLADAGVQLPHGVRAIQTRGMKVKKAVGALTTEKQQKRYIEDMFSLGQQYRGVNIVAGAAGAEFALESGEWNNGVFTASVMQTLADFSTADVNRDGVLSVSELLPAIQAKVQQLTGGAQMPNIVSAENSNMVIATGVGAELMGDNWGSLTNRIRNAASAEEALLIFDRMIAFRVGAESYTTEWQQVLSAFEQAGRTYEAEKLALLKSDFELQHPKNAEVEVYNHSRIPAELWQALLEKGVEPTMVEPWLRYHAEDVGTVLEAMLKAGLSPEGSGDKPLLMEYATPAAVKALLAAGASPDSRNKEGKTLLQKLADSVLELSANDLESMLLLLQNGASTEGIGENSKRYSEFCEVQQLQQALASATPLPAVPEGKAPATLGDHVLLLNYAGAEASVRSYEEGGETTPFTSAADRAETTILAAPDFKQGTVRHYLRTGADTAVLTVFYTPPNCAMAGLVARYADRLSSEQVCNLLVNYMGDGAHLLSLTFDSPTTATAQETLGASCEETIIRNVNITLKEADFRLPEAQ
ncbi:MAG: caspase family protein [Akkermansia sp.]|nr:caspase family protein [Akkermansia sp.]